MLKINLLRLFNKNFTWLFCVTGSASLIFLVYGFYLVWTQVPNDYLQGIYVKIMYVHVPCAWLSMGLYCILGILAFCFLAFRTSILYIFVRAIGVVGTQLALITLITGAIWGQPTWGTWWAWDARLTSMLLLFFIYVGFLGLAYGSANQERIAKISSLFAVIGLINLPIIKLSVNFWNTLHQPASVFKFGGPSIDQSMLIPLLIVFAGFSFLSAFLILLKVKIDLLIAKSLVQSSVFARA
jgi:heme exporter protein C